MTTINIQNDDLMSLLERNNVTVDDFLQETYSCMLVSIFEAIVDEMNDKNFFNRVKQRLRSSEDDILTIQNIVFELVDCKLSKKESKIIYDYLLAFFRKKSKRIIYSNSVKTNKLAEQMYKCNICSTPISLQNSELDHIIPWVMVGDELGESNLQMLCTDCNRRKSKNVTYNLKMFLISKDYYQV